MYLQDLRGKLQGALAREVNEFIDAHSLLLDDAELLRGLEDMVRIGRYRPGATVPRGTVPAFITEPWSSASA